MPNASMPPEFFERLSGREVTAARPGEPSGDEPPVEAEQPLPDADDLWCVYRLRRHGVKLPVDKVQVNGHLGRLRVWRNSLDRSRSAELLASFDRADGVGRLPSLAQVRLLTINRGGVLITGIERVRVGQERSAVGQFFQQTWWCVPTTA